jgi:hypothetical protein
MDPDETPKTDFERVRENFDNWAESYDAAVAEGESACSQATRARGCWPVGW